MSALPLKGVPGTAPLLALPLPSPVPPHTFSYLSLHQPTFSPLIHAPHSSAHTSTTPSKLLPHLQTLNTSSTPNDIGYPPLPGRARVPPNLITRIDFSGVAAQYPRRNTPLRTRSLPLRSVQNTTHTPFLCVLIWIPVPAPRKETEFSPSNCILKSLEFSFFLPKASPKCCD